MQQELSQDFHGRVGTKDPSQAPGPDEVRLPGSAYAQLLIPRLGPDWSFIVIEGTTLDVLTKGPGHYVDTADPWDETGRVGIAGHRTTYLAPFWNLDKMQVGDTITLRTEYGVYDYVVNKVFVVPTTGSGSVLAQTEKPTLVLTTCNPRFSSSQRLIVTADRVEGP